MAAVRQLYETEVCKHFAKAAQVASPDEQIDVRAGLGQLFLSAQERPPDVRSVEITKHLCEFRVQIESPLW